MQLRCSLIQALRYILLLGIVAVLAGCGKSANLLDEYQGQSAKQVLNTGEQYMAKGDYKLAVSSYQALDAMYPFGEYAERGQLDIIYAYYKSGDAASALAAADRFIRLYPRSKNVDYALYMKGLINMGRNRDWLNRVLFSDPAERDMTYMRQAFADLNTLVRMYPNSPYAPDAHRRLVYLRNIFARHEIQVAQFYLVRKAYVGSAERARGVFEHYQGSPYVIDALGIMVKSYEGLHEQTMADNAYRVLAQNYPNSKVYKGLKRKS